MASTPEAALPPAHHPDAALLAEARAALDWWTREAPSRPTSTISGGGAVEVAERALSLLVGGRRVLALPNATFALRVGLQALGVGPDDEVLVGGVDWPAGREAVRSLGARSRAVPVDPDTLAIDPGMAASACTPSTRAVIATHLHGVPADVERLRRLLPPPVAVLEDAAQALGASASGMAAGSLGDMAAFSLGPGKAASAGELGFLAAGTIAGFQAAVRLSQHPLRQLLEGITEPSEANFAARPSPLAALMGAHKLTGWTASQDRLRSADVGLRLALVESGFRMLDGLDRVSPAGRIPLLLNPGQKPPPLPALQEVARKHGLSVTVTASGASVDPTLPLEALRHGMDLVSRVRVIKLAVPRQARPCEGIDGEDARPSIGE